MKFTARAMARIIMPGHQKSQGRVVYAFWNVVIKSPSDVSGA